MEKNSKFTGNCFMWHRILWFLWCYFWSPYFFNQPFCGRPCCKTSIICIKCWSRWFISTNPKKLCAFTSPPSTSLGDSLPNSCVTDGCWFSSISPFVMFSKSINNSLSLFLGHSHYFWFKSNAVATGCLCWLSEYNDCVAGLCCVFTFNFISKQPQIESRKTPHVK